MNVIIKPIVTEKMTRVAEKFNRVGFIVSTEANKIEIRKAVEDMYGVKVVRVNTLNHPGKNKSRYTKAGLIEGRTSAYKKAIVTLAQGETIDFYSNI
ncbi:MAG: 50S ribosomal protein L23 [Bacteroidales bacterium]|nr:50S ribosomal protein L23 [Bacteroidales bacterium]MDE5609061.1 50S ribosomal protein L23 [Bacteroidales bacterium]MDE5762863.1 50S ribosomal protein L23 [Bacteroidales bacterium]MDE6631323.1 50S ribosomal protein L23 [Bacteroidales bacterium]MDE6695159.1 50S ribosomal protein L23 [Bacteroidales bacterium]